MHLFCYIFRGADAPPKDELGWMYKGDKPDSEEYLLGKRIDRYIDESVAAMEKPGTAGKCVAFSV